MIQILIATVILIVAAAIYKRQLDALVSRSVVAKAIKYILIILLAAFVVFLAYMGIGEMSSGDTSGAMHLVTIAPFGILIYLLAIRAHKPAVKSRR